MRLRHLLVLLLVLPFISPTEANAQSALVAVSARSRLTGEPVADATVELAERRIDTAHDGGDVLRPIDEAFSPVSALTDSEGRATFRVDNVRRSTLCLVRVRAPGFGESIDAMVWLNPGANVQREILLRPTVLSPEQHEAIVMSDAEAALTARLMSADADEQPGNGVQLHTAAAITVVPDRVFVRNLEGFTGEVDLDEFIAGVVTREMNDGFPYEALKAQAIAARSYALERLGRTGQANGGQAYTSALGAKCRAAAHNSTKAVIRYNGAIIPAYFSARCNGDFTLASEHALSGLATCTVGGLLGGRFVAYLRSRPCSGHVNCSQTSEQCCDVTVAGQPQHIYGHGVGLCQRGAQDFAGKRGSSWREILNGFYSSVQIDDAAMLTAGSRFEMLTDANRRTTPCGAGPVLTRRGTTGFALEGPRTVACTLVSGTSHLTWWRIQLDTGETGWMAEDFIRRIPTPTGSIQVTIQPPAAVTAGAQWRVSGETIWRSSGTTRSGVALGTHEIEFKPVSGWITPPVKSASVTISKLDVAITSDAYSVMPAPSLLISRDGEKLILSWRDAAGAVLERSVDLKSWEEVSGVNIGQGSVVVTSQNRAEFFRLRRD